MGQRPLDSGSAASLKDSKPTNMVNAYFANANVNASGKRQMAADYRSSKPTNKYKFYFAPELILTINAQAKIERLCLITGARFIKKF